MHPHVRQTCVDNTSVHGKPLKPRTIGTKTESSSIACGIQNCSVQVTCGSGNCNKSFCTVDPNSLTTFSRLGKEHCSRASRCTTAERGISIASPS